CVFFLSSPDFATQRQIEAVLALLPNQENEEEKEKEKPTHTEHLIRVVYDGEDLDAVAHAIGRRKEDVIALHAEREYGVAMLGFLPGFAYLRGLPEVPEALRLPRRGAPRKRVPAGSLAIAAEYTGIYPYASPGGWHLLGRALDFEPFDLSRGESLFAVGDR